MKRIDAYLSSLGYCSRSEAKLFLKQNSVFIKDERVFNPSLKAKHSDITVNSEALDSEKILIVPSISQEEAIENMEALGHSFFIYRDIDLADDIVVLYKREDGSYGSIQCR